MAPQNFAELINLFNRLILKLVPVLEVLALLVFFWGLVKFIFRIGGDEKAVAEGKKLMIWGLVALFIMVCIWGILSFLSGSFGFTYQFPLLPQ